MAIFKYTPRSQIPMARGGARNIMDGSKCASYSHFFKVWGGVREELELNTDGDDQETIDQLARFVQSTPNTALVLMCQDYFLFNSCDTLVINHTGKAYAFKSGSDREAAESIDTDIGAHFHRRNFKVSSLVEEFANRGEFSVNIDTSECNRDFAHTAFVLDISGNIYLTDKAEGVYHNHRYAEQIEWNAASSNVASERETINPNTGEVKMTTIKTTANAIVAANKNAAVNAAKLEAGSIVLKKVSTIAASKAPFMVRGYVDTAVGRVVIANLLNFAVAQYAPGNRKAVIAADAAMQAAMLELVQSFNIGEMLDEVLKGVNLSSLIESETEE